MPQPTTPTSMAARAARWLVRDHVGTRPVTQLTRPRGPWSKAAQLWRILHDRRGILPRRRLYAVAGGVGAVIGVVLGLRGRPAPSRLGMRWWLPVVLVPFAAWVASLTSIWWFAGRAAGSRELWADLVGAVDPDQGRSLRQHHLRDRVLASGLPVLEVVDWPGTARLQAWGGSPKRIEHVEFAFATEPYGRPAMRVAVSAAPASHDDEPRVRERCVTEIAALIAEAASPPDESGPGAESADERRARYRASMAAARAIEWFPTAINLDDRILEGHAIETGGTTLAYYAVPSAWLTVTSNAGELPVLRTVADRERFVTSLVE